MQNSEYTWELDGQVFSGGLVTRPGHGAILTELERAFRVMAPADGLIARAAEQPDGDILNRREIHPALDRRHSPRPGRR